MLHAEKNSAHAFRVQIAAAYAGQKVQVSDADLQGAASKSLTGKLPVLEIDGHVISEANACARYFARSKGHLYGANPVEQAQVDSWVEYAQNTIDLPTAVWVLPIRGVIRNNEAAVARAKDDIVAILANLNKYLATRTYLVGQRITLADIVVSMSLFSLYELVLEPSLRNAHPNTNRWFLTCVNQPEFKQVIGEFKLCQQTQVAGNGPVAAAAAPAAAAKEQPKKEQAKKEQQPKKEQPKKKEKDDDEEDEDDEHKEKPKGKNPLDLLPPSKLVLDEWKRRYSNEDTRTQALPWFWSNYDPEGYCIYFADFKYNEENEVLFKTLNSVNGMFQRLERLHKYGFGSVLICNDNAPFEITACWLFRGKEIPAEVTESEDYELYTWVRADTNDAATRDLISDYFAWDGKLGGKKFNQGKVFK